MNKDADINNEQLLEELAKLRKKNKELEVQLKAANKQIDAKVSQKTNDLRKSQNDYQMLFNESPVPTWEEDFSQCKTYIDSLKKRNIINFREYFENNPDEVIEASKKIKIININKAAVKLHEAKSKQEILHSLSSIFTDKSYETVTEQLICIAEGKKAYESEGIVKTIAGLEKNILLKWVVGSGYENTLEKVFVTNTDITELKRAKDKLKEANQELEANNQQLQAAEQQLRATNQQLETNYQQLIATEKALSNSEDRLSKTLMAANDGMWDWDLKTNNVFFDARYYQMADYHVDEFPHQLEEFQKRIHPEDADYVLHEVQKHIEGKTDRFIVEFRFKKKNGDWLWVRGRGLIVERDKNKAPLRFIGTHTDITERKETEEALRESERKFRNLSESTNTGILLYQNDYLIYANPAAEYISGYTFDELKKMKFWELIAPEYVDLIKERGRARQKGKYAPSGYEFKIITKQGKEKWVLLTGNNTELKSGKAGLVTVFDITKHKLAESKLKDKEKKYHELSILLRLMADNMTDMLWAKNLNNEYVFVNKAICTDLLNTKDTNEPLGKTDMFFAERERNAHPDNPEWHTFGEICKDSDAATLEVMKPMHFDEFGNVRGKFLFLDVHKAPLYDSDGQLIGVVGSARDVTKSKQAEEELIKLSTAVTQSPSIITITDTQGNLEYVNPKFTEITGYTLEEVVGQNPRMLQSGEHPHMFYKEIWKTISSGKTWRGEFHNKKKNGELYWEKASISPIFDKQGKIINYVKVAEDITKQKRNQLIQKVIYNISNAAIAAKSMEDFIKQIQKELGVLMDIKNFFVALYDEKSDNITLAYFQDEKDNIDTFPAEKTLTGLVIKNGKTLLIDDKKAKELEKKGAIDKVGHDSKIWLGVPLKNKGKAFGAFVLQSYENPNAYTEIDKGVLEIISNQISISLERKKEELELKKAKEKAEENKYRLETFIDTIPDIVCYKDGEGRWLMANKADLELFCLTDVDYYGKTDKELAEFTNEIYKKAFSICMVSDEIAWKNKKTAQNIENIPTITGETKSYDVFKIPTFHTDGRRKALAVIGRDITELKKAKEKAEESEYKVRSMFENTQIGILYCDAEGKILEANPVLLNILGSPSMEATSKINLLTFKPLQENGFAQNLKKCISEKTMVTADTVYTSKWGKTVFMKYYLVPVILNNKVIGAWANLNNLTDLWNIQNQLKKAKEKAEESDRLKSAFLANMSHEIRTPMNGILGFTKLLKEPQLTGNEKEKFIQVIEISGKRMLDTINDIIDISKIEAGQVKVVNSEISINKLLVEQYKFFNNEAKSKGLELIYKPSLSEKESHIITDKHKLEGILTNLLKNAVKYTKTGTITFGYHLKDNVNGRFIEFYVKDTGIGIPENRVEAIFNRFEQADIADTKVFEGSGLGLAISKSYVKMLGGEIGVNSKEGSGSTFTFSIPFQIQNIKENVATQNTEKDTKVSLKNLSVIIAEDDETSKIFLETILENHVKQITFSTTGKETIKKFQENPHTDIILMDIKMPDMNGYEATREIRKFNSNVVIIAQTAYGLAGDKDIALEAGCDDYIAKPIDEKILLEKMSAWADKKHI